MALQASLLPCLLHCVRNLAILRIKDKLLAHLSRRLIGELRVYQWACVRPSSVVRSQCSNIFFSETAGPIKAKFYVEPPWVGGDDILLAASGSHDQDGRHANIW